METWQTSSGKRRKGIGVIYSLNEEVFVRWLSLSVADFDHYRLISTDVKTREHSIKNLLVTILEAKLSHFLKSVSAF